MPMDMQKTFDTVVRHLFKQGKQAVNGGGMCQYRTTDRDTGKTLKCAVGCLIPDEIYKPEYEGPINSPECRPIVNYLLGEDLSPVQLFEAQSRPELRLLKTLQRAHDNEHNWKEPIRLANVLRVIAPAFGLEDFGIPHVSEGETWELFHRDHPAFRPLEWKNAYQYTLTDDQDYASDN